MTQKTIEATNYQNVDITISRQNPTARGLIKWTNPDLTGFKVISSQLTGTIKVGANSTATINGKDFQGPPRQGQPNSYQFNFSFNNLISEMAVSATSRAIFQSQITTSNVKYVITYEDGGVIKKTAIYLGDKAVNKMYLGDTLIKKVYLGDKMIYEI